MVRVKNPISYIGKIRFLDFPSRTVRGVLDRVSVLKKLSSFSGSVLNFSELGKISLH